MTAKTQATSFGPGAGRRYGSFAGRTPWAAHPVAKLTQALSHGASAGRRYSSFARTGTFLNIAQTTPLAFTGSASITGNIGFLTAWDVASPIPLPQMAGTLGIVGDIQWTTAHNIAPTSALAFSGALGLTGNIGTILNIAPSTLTFTGSLAVSGDIETTSGPSFDIEATNTLVLSGALSAASDFQYQRPHDLVATSPLAFAGSLGLSGNIFAVATFNVAVTQTLAFSGALGFSGNVGFGLPGRWRTVRLSSPIVRTVTLTSAVGRTITLYSRLDIES